MKRTLNPLAVLIASSALVVLAGVSSASAAADSQSIAIDNFAFAPGDVTVQAGSTLTWTNNQNVRHTSTADNRPAAMSFRSVVAVASSGFIRR